MVNHLSIAAVTAQSVSEWLFFAPGGSDAQARLLADMRDRPRILRFVLRKGPNLLGRFALEIGEVGATTWLPKLAPNVAPDQAFSLLNRIIGRIAAICRERGVKYVEYTSKSEFLDARSWEQALHARGFELIAVRCEWKMGGKWQTPEPPVGCRIVEVSADQNSIEDLYRTSLEGSHDRTSVFEAAQRDTLGAVDRVFIAFVGGTRVGFCACLHEREATSAWVKYIGVVSSYRRTGIGMALLRFSGTEIAAAGASTVRSLIDQENIPSIQLHKAVGFERTDTCGRSYYLVL